MSNVKYNSFGRAIAKNDIDTVTIKAMFMSPSYTPNPDTHVYVSDIVANRAAGTTDLTLSGLTINVDNTDNRTEFVFSTLTTGTITATTNGVAFYISTGVDSTSELLTYNDLLAAGVPTTFTVVSGVLTATVNVSGIFSI
jgi:hypothetical protein